jgi:hypothetical protein
MLAAQPAEAQAEGPLDAWFRHRLARRRATARRSADRQCGSAAVHAYAALMPSASRPARTLMSQMAYQVRIQWKDEPVMPTIASREGLRPTSLASTRRLRLLAATVERLPDTAARRRGPDDSLSATIYAVFGVGLALVLLATAYSSWMG